MVECRISRVLSDSGDRSSLLASSQMVPPLAKAGVVARGLMSEIRLCQDETMYLRKPCQRADIGDPVPCQGKMLESCQSSQWANIEYAVRTKRSLSLRKPARE